MLIVISGLHRSGTTFVGDILRHAGASVVHEPLNERFGMSGVPIAYPFAENSNSAFSVLLDDAIHLSRPWNKDVAHIQAKGIRKRFYALSGGSNGLHWEWMRFRRSIGLSPQHLCFKDPFMSLATPYLVKHLGLHTVCMIRHPAAIHYSTEKQNWRFDVDNLLRQPELIAQYGEDIPHKHWNIARKHPAASIALLWKLMMRINISLSKKDGRLLMILHEELCTMPHETVSKILNHFGIHYSSRISRHVSEYTGGDRIEARDGHTHDFHRNSKSIPSAWHGKLTTNEQQLIFEIAGDEINMAYDESCAN